MKRITIVRATTETLDCWVEPLPSESDEDLKARVMADIQAYSRKDSYGNDLWVHTDQYIGTVEAVCQP